MPLYAYNIFTITCLYLAILYLNTYKDISIKGKETYNKLLFAFKLLLLALLLLVILARLFLPVAKAPLSLPAPLSNLARGF
ncbi:unnamed protein product [Fusarium fujikuroi]|nr:unnamed protein product [Fusarium fujikuroi]